jgi:hypothetical protein
MIKLSPTHFMYDNTEASVDMFQQVDRSTYTQQNTCIPGLGNNNIEFVYRIE